MSLIWWGHVLDLQVSKICPLKLATIGSSWLLNSKVRNIALDRWLITFDSLETMSDFVICLQVKCVRVWKGYSFLAFVFVWFLKILKILLFGSGQHSIRFGSLNLNERLSRKKNIFFSLRNGSRKLPSGSTSSSTSSHRQGDTPKII